MASGYSSDSEMSIIDENVVPRVVKNVPRRTGVCGRVGRGRGRGGVNRGSSTVPNLHGSQDSLKTEISGMTRSDMINMLHRVVDVEPGFLFHVLKPSTRPKGGYHPDPDNPSPAWCVCGFCREMPTEAERVCCLKHNCVSRTERFETLVLDEGVLAVGRMMRRDILVFPDEDLGEDQDDINRANRFYAYIQFTYWSHGRLGTGNRVPIPACCVWRIRDKFPNPFGQYVGYIPARI